MHADVSRERHLKRKGFARFGVNRQGLKSDLMIRFTLLTLSLP